MHFRNTRETRISKQPEFIKNPLCLMRFIGFIYFQLEYSFLVRRRHNVKYIHEKCTLYDSCGPFVLIIQCVLRIKREI